MPTATLKIFLAFGDPKRLRTAELSNWTGKAVAGPRSEFEKLLGREESLSPGVYFLTGTDPDTNKGAIYIGEAECITDRIKSHLSKDFWNNIVFFITKDENLTKAHIRYIEGRLMAQRNKLIEEDGLVQNGDKYDFVKDTEFSSPSSAAAVIHGGSANGLTAWVNKDGKSLKNLQNV